MEKTGFAGKDQDGLFSGLNGGRAMKKEVLKCDDT